MTRKFFLTTTTLAALAFAPAAMAESVASQMPGNSPEVTDGGKDNEVASTQGYTYDTNSPRVTNGKPEVDGVMINMPRDKFLTLANAKGDAVVLQDGMVLGTVASVGFNAQGNSEIAIALVEDSKIDADRLIVTATPENINFKNGALYLMTDEDNLYLRARDGSVRSAEGRRDVTLLN